MSLSYSFIILQLLGLWQPDWSPGWKTKVYGVYSFFMIIFIFTNILSELIELFRSFTSHESFIKNSIKLLAMLGAFSKLVNIALNGYEIKQLIKIIQSRPCRAENTNEQLIQANFNRIIKNRTLAYAALSESSVMLGVTLSLLRNVPKRLLTYKAWFPFSPTTNFRYWIVFTHQILSHFFGSLVNIAFDTLLPGLMLQICCQLQILGYRVSLISDTKSESASTPVKMWLEQGKISNCIKYHLKILQLSKMANKIFSPVLFIQFTISTIVICVSIYGLSKTKVCSPDFALITFYLACMLVQIFILCYAGTEITLESYRVAEMIYSMDWLVLSKNVQKSLLMIMTRSRVPIIFTSNYFVELSIDSFNQIVKLSYSAYNVIQQTSE
uniref:Odorant receptor n=1 Tax=Aulacocentrum confusum TaxID=2767324 RepID=A0A7G8Z967_9HYME|nr:olfactory receptor 48 [Aulacocentrum confusum]